jgi:CheY-like chemotaxis protein
VLSALKTVSVMHELTPSILVVEDNRELREKVCRELEGRGCHVTAVSSGAEGLEAVVLSRFDLVVSDVVMLPRGGLWLWREATSLRPELRGRFIFCGADGLPDSFEGPIQTERFLSEPLDWNTLWAEVLAVTNQPQA